jgi:anaerobic ribonucleoside-triphosphate reductase
MTVKNGMVILTKKQLETKEHFIYDYIKASNAADGSKWDKNANVSFKNISTLANDLNKDIMIQINRHILAKQIENDWGTELSKEYIRQLEKHEIYCHDESSLNPYCASISMYPFLIDGMTKLGGESKAPKHLDSFCGSFINLCFAISSQFAGALATVEFLLYFDHFARRDYGDNYLETHTQRVNSSLQHVVYSLNQPAVARGYQCVREDTTQLSTPEGYKYLSELKVGDECYVWKNNKISIEKIKKLNVYDFDDELLQFKGRNYQQTVTPNHRVVYKKTNSNLYDIKEAKDLFGHSKLSLPIASELECREDFPIKDDLLRLCVVALTDGSIENKIVNNNLSGRLIIYKSKNRWGYKEIPEMLNNLNISFTQTDIKTNQFGEMVQFKLKTLDSQVILRQIKHTKKEIPFFFKLLSKRQLDIVIETWSKIDGTQKSTTNCMLQCDNDTIRDQLQELVFLAGYGSEIYDRNMTKLNSDEECIVKYVKVFGRKNKRISEYNKIKYTGKVWCPTTDAGVVVFREENKIPYISGNSIFWNISIFDEDYFNALFGDFVFPDNYEKASYEKVKIFQEYFMKWFNKEREVSLLTFPVVTAALLSEDNKPKDEYFSKFISNELAEGNSFFIYQSDSADSLSSCCRLKNEFQEKPEFSFSLGAGGISTGSINVITLNLNRLFQDTNRYLEDEIDKIHKYQISFRRLIEKYEKGNLLSVYNSNFISLDKQFLTIGLNGIVEAAEYLGIVPDNNEKYKQFLKDVLETIYNKNRRATKEYGYKFNTEFVPAESLGVKFSQWDKKKGYDNNRDCYNSYFYRVEDEKLNIIDKFELHGKEITKYLDGGSALHLNLEEHYDADGYYKLICLAIQTGVSYFTTNVKATCCEDCFSINKKTLDYCIKCGSKNISHATRIIGYLKKIKDFSQERREEHSKRFYH